MILKILTKDFRKNKIIQIIYNKFQLTTVWLSLNNKWEELTPKTDHDKACNLGLKINNQVLETKVK